MPTNRFLQDLLDHEDPTLIDNEKLSKATSIILQIIEMLGEFNHNLNQ
jgi:hypothetical protein